MKRKNTIVGLGLCLSVIGTFGFVRKQKLHASHSAYIVTKRLSKSDMVLTATSAGVGSITAAGGAAWGAQVGAEIGFIGGPVGSLLGGAFGAVVGAL